MRLIKMSSLVALATVAAMAFVGATSASGATPTQLCNAHSALTCGPGQATTSVHWVLAAGTVHKLLSSLVTVLCLGDLLEATPLALGNPQNIHISALSLTGCGTSSTHSNCTVTSEEQPLGTLLKLGLDFGTLQFNSGRKRLQCSNLGIDCKYDLEATLFSIGSQHLTAENTPTSELGGKFFCPNEGQYDGLLVSLFPTYVLA